MIKIGNEKLFTMTELLESAREHFKDEPVAEIYGFEIETIAAIIGESADFVRGFVTSNRN